VRGINRRIMSLPFLSLSLSLGLPFSGNYKISADHAVTQFRFRDASSRTARTLLRREFEIAYSRLALVGGLIIRNGKRTLRPPAALMYVSYVISVPKALLCKFDVALSGCTATRENVRTARYREHRRCRFSRTFYRPLTSICD